jgi:hypothetical protein
MSIRKSHIPELEQIKKQYIMLGHNDFVKRYEKVEIFIGSPGGVDFIQEKLKEGKKVQKIQ